MVEVLLEAGANITVRSALDECSALDAAAFEGHVRILKAILSFGADANACRENGSTALHIAAQHDHVEAVEALIDAGANSELRTDRGSTPLLSAASRTACKAMRALLQHGAAVDARDIDGFTALHSVCDEKQERLEEAVSLLLRWGADETVAPEKGGCAPADLLYEPVPFDAEYKPSQDEIKRVRLLLAQAPADRAWRRRNWLVMMYSRISKARGAGCNTEDGPTNGGAVAPKMTTTEEEAEGKLGGSPESTMFGNESGALGQGKGLVGVVTASLELQLDGVFRAVMSFF